MASVGAMVSMYVRFWLRPAESVTVIVTGVEPAAVGEPDIVKLLPPGSTASPKGLAGATDQR
jgi:hypothetical protein